MTPNYTAEDIGAIIENFPTDRDALDISVQGVRIIQNVCYGLSLNAGWHKTGELSHEAFATKIALIHSEVSEALEGGRKNAQDEHLPHRKSVEVELADAVIRIFDLAGKMNLDIAGAIVQKLAYNQKREDHKPEARAAAGGKKF